MSKHLSTILGRISAGAIVTADELLPYLSREGSEERAEINAMLADAYFQARNPDQLHQARVFIERAWQLAKEPSKFYPLYLKILSELKDTPGIRAACKRLGMLSADEGDIAEAIRYFDAWQYAYYIHDKVDHYTYDFDILNCMERLSAPYKVDTSSHVPRPLTERIRVAYLVKGITEVNSILIQINLKIAELHDKSRFEVLVCTPESVEMISDSPTGLDHMKAFENVGCSVITAPQTEKLDERLLGLGRSIAEARPDIMVTSAALADFSHYFITLLRPAPVVIGLVQGPTPQFAAPNLDWCIAWSRHPQMDCPVPCSMVPLSLSWPQKGDVTEYNRSALGLSDEACVLMSAGRYTKFQDIDFWRAIVEVISQHPETFYVVVGPEEREIECITAVLSSELRSRIHFLGWREDFLQILGLADIVIDTYPSGGGQVLVQAMHQALPIVGHRNDYMNAFDQRSWSPVEDFIQDSELVVPRGDFEQFKRTLSRLIEDQDYRIKKGEVCRAVVSAVGADQGVKECEEIYRRVYEFCWKRDSSKLAYSS